MGPEALIRLPGRLVPRRSERLLVVVELERLLAVRRAFIEEAVRSVKGLGATVISDAAALVAAALIAELQASGRFVLAGVGTFSLCEAKGVPATHAGASAQKTVQFEACSSVLHQV